jgi:hypothetical protein
MMLMVVVIMMTMKNNYFVDNSNVFIDINVDSDSRNNSITWLIHNNLKYFYISLYSWEY